MDQPKGRMKFRITPLVFETDVVECTVETAPTWFRSYAKWFIECHVKKLSVGEYVLTDFHKIERIE